jgi:thiol-disulfide isomerase/thioredoxin
MEVTGQLGVKVLYFYTDWCASCKNFNPYYQRAIAELGSMVTHQSINTDQDKDSAAKYAVTSVPTIIILKNGTEFFRNVGELSINRLKNLVRGNL